MPDHDFSGLRATFVNCTLKRSPEVSNTQGLVDASAGIMRKHGVEVSEIRFVDHDIATGVYPDMTEHGWASDEWPQLYPGILASDILVVAGPIWLGDNSSETKKLIERIYALSGETNDKGQYLFYGRVGGCIITGNEDGIKHCAQNVLYSLQHVGYTIPPNADAGWIGEVITRMSAAITFSEIAGQSSRSHPCSVMSGHTPVAMSWSTARTTSTCTPCRRMISMETSASPRVCDCSGLRLSVQLMNSARRSLKSHRS